MPALQAFEYGYLFRMVGNGYMQKYLVEGNDSRGIDVAVLMREKTRHGEPIEMVDIRSHALLTYNDLALISDELTTYSTQHDKTIKPDCPDLNIKIRRKP